MKLEQPYDRLVLCRDIRDGTLFMIVCKDERQAIQLFLMKDCRWVGMCVCLFEPEFEFRIAGMPALSTEHPLLPLREHDLGDVVAPYEMEWAMSGATKALYVRGADLRQQHVNIVEGCAAAMCDNQHGVTERCCALTSAIPNKLILRCIVSSKEAGIVTAKFQSTALTLIMMEEDCTTVNAGDLLDYVQVRRACQQVLEFYAEAQIGWTICGWFKPGMAVGAEVTKKPRMHVTSMCPDRLIADAPRYRCPARPVAAERHLQL
ncbi:PREDICTED: uncharacterized protein LOC106810482 [Priapulus caudatus]|uniref:Uncharacterized protein LOC106810482 n=1 Tax=Priapulus caudatus TaxID=37621 RepID=A0ABM1EAX5_PRICU|nr:PREDICTED: uncharacterized protein LOC106810482 [Priapulus caudatus]